MLDLYEDYASQEEREDAVMLEQAEIAMDRAILAFKTCEAMEALSMREAECKLVMESGDVCDLVEYYGEAAEETEKKKEGLFTTIWNKILDFLKKIKETLFGKKGSADPNKEYETDQSFLDRHEKLKKAHTAVKAALQNPGVRLIATAIAAILAVLGIKAVGKKIKLKGDKINNMTNEEEKITNELESSISSAMKKNLGAFGSIVVDKMKELQTRISEMTTALKTNASHLIGLYTKEDLENAEKSGKMAGFKAGKRLGRGDSKKEKEYLTPEERKKKWEANGKPVKSFNAGKLGKTNDGEGYDYDRFLDSADVEDFGDDIYDEDAGDLSDIAELLADL